MSCRRCFPRSTIAACAGATHKGRWRKRAITARLLLEIVNDCAGTVHFEHLLDELNMRRMHLVFILRLLRVECKIQRHLIALLHHVAVALQHLAHVKEANSWDRAKILLCAFHQRVRRVRDFGLGPEDHNVTEHKSRDVADGNPRVQAANVYMTETTSYARAKVCSA